MATEKDLLYRAKFVDDVSPGVSSMSSAWQKEFKAMEASLQDNIIKLRAQKELLSDPVYQQSAQQAAKLRNEINELTKATLVENEAVQLTSRSRKELIVLMHELSQGRYKNFGGSLMVLEEGNGGIMGALKAVTAMLGGPYVIAAGAAALATGGVAAALWHSSEAAAENWHKMEQLGQTLGVSGQTMLGFQYLSVGTTVSTEQMGHAFGRFTVNLSEHRAELEKLGITARDPVQAFEQLMDVAQRTTDPLERNNILNKALGENWQKLAPILLQGGDAAREAIEKMAIPEETIKSYERANKAQIEIDRTWILVKSHAGEAMASTREYFKEMELGILKIMSSNGLGKASAESIALSMAGPLAPLIIAAQLRYAQLVGKSALAGKAHGMAPELDPGYTEAQQKALDFVKKGSAKDSLQTTLELIHTEYLDKAKAFKADSDEYKNIMRAELQAEENAKKAWAKAHKGSSSGSRVGENVDEFGNLREGRGFGEEGFKKAASADREKAEQTDRRKAEESARFVAKASENSAQIRLKWIGAIEAARRKEHDEHVKEITKEADLVQGFAAKELSTALQGKMTMRSLEESATAFLADQFAERTTKWIEQKILESVFSKAAGVEATTASVAEASVVSAAWAPASMAASIGTFGAASVAGEAAWFNAMAAGSVFSAIPGHANGGFEMGNRFMAGERGAETVRTVVPTQITQASHTTNNNSSVNHYHFHGYSEGQVLRTIRKAQTNGAQVSRS